MPSPAPAANLAAASVEPFELHGEFSDRAMELLAELLLSESNSSGNTTLEEEPNDERC